MRRTCFGRRGAAGVGLLITTSVRVLGGLWLGATAQGSGPTQIARALRY